jgi:hypothetical protein
LAPSRPGNICLVIVTLLGLMLLAVAALALLVVDNAPPPGDVLHRQRDPRPGDGEPAAQR